MSHFIFFKEEKRWRVGGLAWSEEQEEWGAVGAYVH